MVLFSISKGEILKIKVLKAEGEKKNRGWNLSKV